MSANVTGKSTKVSAPPAVDLLQQSIGQFGKYHYWQCFLIFLTKFAIAWHQMAIIFLSPKISFTCNGAKDACPCKNPVYDTSVFSRTTVMEWNLICEKKWLTSFQQTTFQAGTLFGSVFFGMAADRLGRRRPFLFACVLQITSGMAAAFVPNIWMFILLRFVVGLSVGGTMVIGFVILMEFTGVKYRALLSAVYQIPFNLGHLTLPLFGYYLRDYSHFQLGISIPDLVFLMYFFFVPETPRWLLAEKRTEDAIAISEKVAKWNGLPVENVRSNLIAYQQILTTHHLKKAVLWDLFKTPNLRRNILAMAFNWLACSYCFYGVSQYISHFTGDIFTNVAMSAAVTLCGTLLCIPLMTVLGRKTMLLIFNLVCAVCLFILAFLPEGIASVILASLGDVSAFIVFIIVYLYTGELFPTVVRNSAIGFCSMSARVGSMIAPFVIDLHVFNDWMPAVVFGLLPALAVFISLLLPETKNCELMSTLEEGEEFRGTR